MTKAQDSSKEEEQNTSKNTQQNPIKTAKPI